MSCHPEHREGSEKRQLMYFSLRSTTRQILHYAQNDIMIGKVHFDTPSTIQITNH